MVDKLIGQIMSVVILFGGVWLLCIYIRHKIDRATGGLLSPEQIKILKEEVERDARERPRSVAAMTSIYLPKIAKDFPDFNYVEMQRRAETTLISYLRAIDEENPKLLLNAGPELKANLQLYMGMLKDSGIHENFDDIHIHRTEISRYMKDPGRCIITFQCSLECKHNKIKDGEVVEGSEEFKYQAKYELDMVYIQDRDKVESDYDKALGYNCPNCGAPVKSLKYKVCEYCGTGLVEYNIKVWTFAAVRELGKI